MVERKVKKVLKGHGGKVEMDQRNEKLKTEKRRDESLFSAGFIQGKRVFVTSVCRIACTVHVHVFI